MNKYLLDVSNQNVTMSIFFQSCQQSETRSVGRATAVVANAVATTLVS